MTLKNKPHVHLLHKIIFDNVLLLLTSKDYKDCSNFSQMRVGTPPKKPQRTTNVKPILIPCFNLHDDIIKRIILHAQGAIKTYPSL